MSTFYQRHHKGLRVFIIGLLLLLFLLYVLAPWLTKYYLNNHVLNDMDEYQGRIERLTFRPLLAQAGVHEFSIWRKDGEPDSPIFYLHGSNANLRWRDLMGGRLGAQITLERPEVTIVAVERPPEEEPPELDWEEMLQAFEDLPDFIVYQLHITEGKVTFVDPQTDPTISIQLSELDLLLTDLTNIREIEGERIASLQVGATLFEQGKIVGRAKVDPYNLDNFEFAAEVTEIHLTELNDFARAYAALDFARGHGEVLIEAKASEGELSGYIKPLFEDIEILNWEQDVVEQDKGPLNLLWEGLANFLKSVLLNPGTEKVATEIEFEGTLEELELDTWGAIGGFFRNAFVESITGEFESITSLTRPGSAEDQDEDNEGDSEEGE